MSNNQSNLMRDESNEMATPVPFQFDDIQLLAKRILEKTNTQAQRVLDAARKQAMDIEKAAYDDGHQKGYDESLAKGFEEGRTKGEKEAREEVLVSTLSLAKSLEAILEELSKTKVTLKTAAEVDMISLAIAIAEKIVKRAVELDSEVAKANAIAAVELIIERRDITLHVCPKDLKAIEEHLPALKKKFDDLERVSVVADEAIGRGGVRAVTQEGSVNLSVEHQVQAIGHSLLGGVIARSDSEEPQNILDAQPQPEPAETVESPEENAKNLSAPVEGNADKEEEIAAEENPVTVEENPVIVEEKNLAAQEITPAGEGDAASEEADEADNQSRDETES